MYARLVDYQQARPDAAGYGAADVLDPDADIAEALGQMAHDE